MLRKFSYRVWCATNELCRVSPALSKLLTYEANFRGYRGRKGITYDDDSSFDDQEFDAPSYRPKSSFSTSRSNYDEFDSSERRNYKSYDDSNDDGFDGRERRNYRNYNDSNRDGFNSRERRNYRNYDNQNFTGFDRGERSNYRNYGESSNRKGYQFRNEEYGNRRPFFKQNPGSGFNQSFEPQRLIQPVFDINNLPPIEKNFYIEHPDVTQRSVEEVQSYRERLSISVRGSDVPNPITTFEELSLPDRLKGVVGEQEYSEPTPIQAQGWPIALSGRDMVGISQTGSGKTLVYVLPGLIHALNQPNSESGEDTCKPQVLILAPTRELVQQILGVSEKFSNSCDLISSCAYGGASKFNQRRLLRGANICVATPGRLIDFVSEGFVNLQHCTYLVLDEADRMLDMGFEPQIRQIVGQTRNDRQTLMWSATWPKEIQNLAEDFLTDYVQVTVGAGELVANPKIEQNIYVVDEREKEERLLSLLQEISSDEKSKVLVFAQTKRKVDYLGRYLHSEGMPVMCIHGDVSQSRRDNVLNNFRRQESCILIATDVAARGLDITDVQCVINYDLPSNIEDYIHRIGRTARGDASGVAHSFFTHENENIAKDLATVLKQAGQNISQELFTVVNSLRKGNNRGNFYNPRKFDFRQRRASF